MLQGDSTGYWIRGEQRDGDSTIYREETVGPGLHLILTVVLDSGSFDVRHVAEDGITHGTDTTQLRIIYAHDQRHVHGHIQLPDGTFDFDTLLPEPVLDEKAMMLMLPSFGLVEGTTVSTKVYSAMDRQVWNISVDVGTLEPIDIPAGTFQARRLTVTGGWTPQILYITDATAARPLRLLKIINGNGNNRAVFELRH